MNISSEPMYMEIKEKVYHSGSIDINKLDFHSFRLHPLLMSIKPATIRAQLKVYDVYWTRHPIEFNSLVL